MANVTTVVDDYLLPYSTFWEPQPDDLVKVTIYKLDKWKGKTYRVTVREEYIP